MSIICNFLGHDWSAKSYDAIKACKCKRCKKTFGSVLLEYLKNEDGVKLAKEIEKAEKQNKVCVLSVSEAFALVVFSEPKFCSAYTVQALKLMYEYTDKNIFAYLLGLTKTKEAAEFIAEKLQNKLGNYIEGHFVAVYNLSEFVDKSIVLRHISSSTYPDINSSAPFYYALGAYKDEKDIPAISRYIRGCVAKHNTWGFPDALKFAVAGIVNIGGKTAFDELLTLADNIPSATWKSECAVIVLYGAVLLSANKADWQKPLFQVLIKKYSEFDFTCKISILYLLSKLDLFSDEIIAFAEKHLEEFLSENRLEEMYPRCTAGYLLWLLGIKGWNKFEQHKKQLSSALGKYNIVDTAQQFFADIQSNEKANKMISQFTSVQFTYPNQMHNIEVAYLPKENKRIRLPF